LGLDSCDKARCIQGCWDELAASLVKLADVCKVGFDFSLRCRLWGFDSLDSCDIVNCIHGCWNVMVSFLG
jgi:hypothetical protein